MNGHHLILGELTDYVTGERLARTHDELYRQELSRLLIEDKQYLKSEVEPRTDLVVRAGEKKAVIKVDFTIRLSGRIGMVIKYGPGSIVTRHRSSLAISRLMAPYQIPVVVVTNGIDADIIDGRSGEVRFSGLDAVPSKSTLVGIMQDNEFRPIAVKQVELENRIVYAYEVDGSCPCDDTICRL